MQVDVADVSDDKLIDIFDKFYSDENSEEIAMVIQACEIRAEKNNITFDEAWFELEAQEIACMLLNSFDLDIRSKLEHLELKRAQEEAEKVQEDLDRDRDWR